METRKCSTCKRKLSLDNFTDTKKKKFKTCNKCKSDKEKYYQDNKIEIAEKGKVYRENNKEEIKIRKHNYRKNNIEKIKIYEKKYREENKEEISIKRKEYYQNNKEDIKINRKEYYENNKEEILEQRKEYYQNNKEKIAKKDHKYYQNNKEKIAERDKEYRKNNKEKISERQKEYDKTPQGRANKINGCIKRRGYGDLTIIKEDWISIMFLNEWKCFYCDIPLTEKNRSVDHLIPLSKGGKHSVDNLLPACLSCNSSKFDKDIESWEPFKNLLN